MHQIVQFLWTRFFMQDWSLSALLFVRTLWTGYCELLDSAVALWTGYWVTHWELLWIKFNCVVRSCAAHNTTRVFEQWLIFNPAFAVRNATAHVRLQCCRFLTTPTRFDLWETPVTTFTFSLVVCFCYVPTVLSRYGLLRERIVFCFHVISSFVCINLIFEWTITHWFPFLWEIFFCMCSFEKKSSSSVDSPLQRA